MRDDRRSKGRKSRAGRMVLWTVLVLALLAIALFIASALIEEPLRRTMEQRMNESLEGYSVQVAELDIQWLSVAFTLHDLIVRQDAHPEPPVATIPELRASIHWRELLRGRLVSDWRIDEPRFYVNLRQLQQEWEDEEPLDERGWREALEEIHPFKFNLIRIADAELVYLDEEFDHPLRISRLNATLENIRSIRTSEGRYPSPIQVDAVVLEEGTLQIEGNADFLADPHPAILARIDLRDVPLQRIGPVASRADLWVSGGLFSANGEIEFAPEAKSYRLTEVVVNGLHLDYTITQEPEEESEEDSPLDTGDSSYRIERLLVTDAEIGLVNETQDPSYRIFLSEARLDVQNLAEPEGEEPTDVHITGLFMGSGNTDIQGRFQTLTGEPDFNLSVKIEGTRIPAMQDLLQAHIGIEPSEGWFALYSEVTVRDGRIDGYARPFFEELQIEDDKDEGLLKELYEKALDVIASLLENPRDEVATEFDLSGEIDDPETSTWQIIVNLVKNAFIEAIIPGFGE